MCAALLGAALLCADVASGTAPANRITSDPPAFESLAVPGGTAALARAAGIDPTLPRARVMLTAIRVLHELTEGVDAAADSRRRRVVKYLQQLDALAPALGVVLVGDTVPLPLPAAAWTNVPDSSPDGKGSLLTRILGHRHTALAYYGLCAMDGPTRAFIAASPAALAAVFDPMRSPVLALYGRSLRVRGARVEVPGGEAAVALWEDLTGAPVSDPALFITRILDKDQGRLALLYDVVAHLDTPAQSFALGLAELDPARRAERFGAVYAASAAALVAWDPRARPFERVMYDSAQLLMQMVMLPDGRPSGPAWRRFWEAAFASGESAAPPARALGGTATQGLVDAAWLAQQVSVTSTTLRRQRAEGWMFAQRIFPTPAPDTLEDILVAVKGLARFNALVLTLERMGIGTPATYAAAVRTADTIARADASRAWASLAQFQGVLAIIERTRFARAIDAREADRLVRSLCAVPLTRDGDYLGAMGSWLESWLLSSNGPPIPGSGSTGPDRPIERHVLAVLAGAVTSSPFADPSPVPTMEWEGLRYRVDPAGSMLRRLQEVREVQGGPSLDAVLALVHQAEALLRTTNMAVVLDRMKAVADEAAALRMPRAGNGQSRRPDEPDLRDTSRNLWERFQTNRANPDGSDVVRAVNDVRRAADWYLARILQSIAYAPHLGARNSRALLGGDPSVRHDFGLTEVRPDIRALTPWQLPVETRDRATGWRVTGSLLGLDLALGRLALRRAPREEMPQPPRLSDVERQAITEAAVLLSPFDQTEAGRDRLVAALARGRARLAAAEASAEALVEAGADVGLDEWRLQMLPWMRDHEQGRLRELLSLAEVVKLGSPERDSSDGFDAFGASMWSVRGQLACRFPWQQPWTTLAGRMGSRMVPGLVPDLVIGVAESLAALKLPARLSAGVLSVATQELLDTIRVDHDDDWLGLVAQAQRVAGSRIEEYVAALTNDGPLVPVVTEPRHANRQ
jgi:hypothetical protein